MPSKILQKNVVYAIGSAGNAFALTLLVPYLIRTLTTPEFGAWALSEVVIVLVSTLMTLGMDVGLMREYWCATETAQRKRLAGTVLTAQLIWSVTLLGICLCFIGQPSAHQWLATRLQVASPLAWSGIVLGISLLEGMFGMLLSLFRIRERAAYFVALSMGRVVLLVLFAYSGVRIVGGVEGALGGRALGVMVSVIVAGFLARREISAALDWNLLKRVLAYGLPLLPTGLAGYILFASDRYFLQGLRGLEAVAVYTFAYKIAGLVDLLVTRPFALDWAPRRFRIASESGAQRKYASALLGYLFCATAGGSAVIVAAPYIYHLFAPASYNEGMAVVPILVISYIIFGLSYPLNVGIMLRNRTILLPMIGGVAAAICIVLNVLLIPTFGMVGAAWATCGAYIIWSGAIAMVSLRHFPIRYPWIAMTVVVCGGVLASLGRALLERHGSDGTGLRDVLVSGAWLLVVFSVMGYLLWGRSAFKLAWKPASASEHGLESSTRPE